MKRFNLEMVLSRALIREDISDSDGLTVARTIRDLDTGVDRVEKELFPSDYDVSLFLGFNKDVSISAVADSIFPYVRRRVPGLYRAKRIVEDRYQKLGEIDGVTLSCVNPGPSSKKGILFEAHTRYLGAIEVFGSYVLDSLESKRLDIKRVIEHGVTRGRQKTEVLKELTVASMEELNRGWLKGYSGLG